MKHKERHTIVFVVRGSLRIYQDMRLKTITPKLNPMIRFGQVCPPHSSTISLLANITTYPIGNPNTVIQNGFSLIHLFHRCPCNW